MYIVAKNDYFIRYFSQQIHLNKHIKHENRLMVYENMTPYQT